MIASASSRVNARSVSVWSPPKCWRLRDDLERDLVVGRLEHLDDVVAAERHPDADERSARLLDRPLALFHAVAPGGEPVRPCVRPAHQRDVVGHAALSLQAVRLNAYLARAGIASRRGADELIRPAAYP